MNRTLGKCYSTVVEFSFLHWRQMVVLTVTNSIVMAGNITANMLIIHILIKTKQIVNNTCKLFFMLSVSDLVIGLFCQNLQTITFYENSCSTMNIYAFITVFSVHLSMYTIALIGIDRYLRIKHYASFKALWTTRAVLVFISIEVFLAFMQATMTLIGLLSGKEYIVLPFYYTIDGLIISGIILLQILTIRKSKAVCNESRIDASRKTNKKITRLSMQIMLLFCCFTTPQLMMYVLRELMLDKLNDYEKSLVDFFAATSVIVLYSNSFANAVLFLMINVKAKRYLRGSFRRISQRSLGRIGNFD